MLESKFSFIGKIFLIAFFIINLPSLFPVNFNVTYFLIVTTTIFDTSTLLIFSLAISKFIHIKNLSSFEKLNAQNSSDNKHLEQIKSFKIKINNDNKLSFIFAISFAFFTLIQPIILILDFNKNDVYSGAYINIINSEYNDQKSTIEDLILKEKTQNNDKKELKKLENRITTLSELKDKQIDQIIKDSNINKFANVKLILRNLLLGSIFTLCFYKILKI